MLSQKKLKRPSDARPKGAKTMGEKERRQQIELLGLLMSGDVKKFNDFRNNWRTRKINVIHADFKGFNFSNVDFRDAYFDDVNFSECNFYRANFTDADFCDVNFHGANLREADLQNANLQGVDFRYSDLQGASLKGANLEEADLRGANLKKSDLCWSNLFEVKINDNQKDTIINAIGIY